MTRMATAIKSLRSWGSEFSGLIARFSRSAVASAKPIWDPMDLWFTKRYGANWLNAFLNSTWFDLLVFVLSLPFAYASRLKAWELASVYFLLVGQNVSFTWVSRARQTKSLFFHRMMSVLSNGFYIFVVTAYVAYYKNTPMKLVYVAGTIIGASLGHRSAIWLENKKTFSKDAVVTRQEFAGQLALDFQNFYASSVNPVQRRILQVYLRCDRKLRRQMTWVKNNYATKQELAALRVEFEKRLVPVFVTDNAEKKFSALTERTRIVRMLNPAVSKPRPSRRWISFERAGQLRLGL